MRPTITINQSIRRLYSWTLSLAQRKSAVYWLAIIAFVESSVFPIPADVLFIPMVLARRLKAYYFALVATLSSVAGGVFGYMIGLFAYYSIAKPILEFYGKFGAFEALRDGATMELVLVLSITSGLAHLPPIKIVTILAGIMGINFWAFVLLSLISRGARFYFLAWLVSRYGETIMEFVLQRVKTIATLICALIIAAAIFYLLM